MYTTDDTSDTEVLVTTSLKRK